MEFIEMKIVKDRNEWRNKTLRFLIKEGRKTTDAIEEIKEIEGYVFDSKNELIIQVENNKQLQALKTFVESLQPT